MNIHEYQGKQLLKACGVCIPDGYLACSPEEAVQAAEKIGGSVWVVKAQIHAGGRGKGGGVKLAKTIEEVKDFATDMLGMTLITPQTGPEGRQVQRLYVEAGCDIAKQLYFSMLVDRSSGKIVAVASTEGGMEIEEVAENSPEKIVKVFIDPLTGFQGFHARKLAYALNLSKEATKKVAKVFQGVYKVFTKYDASLIEINPLVITGSDDVIALDAKMDFDDNALYRQQQTIEPLRDLAEEDPKELEAAKHSLSYVKLDGNIGCMVNGAGLAMATMDIIKLCGGEPANFLDVGGGATRERVAEALKIILSDTGVEAILVNIFGGIMRCDVIAEGIVAAAKDVGITVPLVVRLAGTNVELGKEILSQSGLKIMSADTLDTAATQVMKAVKEAA